MRIASRASEARALAARLDAELTFEVDRAPALRPELASDEIAQLQGRTFPSSTAETILALEELANRHPDFVPIHRYLESFYQLENRLEDSRRAGARVKELLGS